jgi:hypothetical protein
VALWVKALDNDQQTPISTNLTGNVSSEALKRLLRAIRAQLDPTYRVATKSLRTRYRASERVLPDTAMARPTKYKPEYCELVIDTMAAGKSLAAAAAQIRVARSTFYEWAKEYPDMAEAVAIGKDLSLAYWEQLAHDTATGESNGNASVLNFQMKNRFRNDYTDSQDLRLSGGEDPIRSESMHTIKFVLPDGHSNGAQADSTGDQASSSDADNS